MRKIGALGAVILSVSGAAIAGDRPASATQAPSGSIVSNTGIVSTLIAINGTSQPTAVVRDIGLQVANLGGEYNPATGNVRALVDAGPAGFFVLTIEDGKVSFIPA